MCLFIYSLYVFGPCYLFLKGALVLKSFAQALSFSTTANCRLQFQGFRFPQTPSIFKFQVNKRIIKDTHRRHQASADYPSQDTIYSPEYKPRVPTSI